MKQVLVLGAGRSSPYLIARLLDLAEENDWFITVGDLDIETAQQAVGHHERGSALRFDVNDVSLRSTQISSADVVVNMLAPTFQDQVAWDCVSHGRHMLTASYLTPALRDLGPDAQRQGVLLLAELGLDPGIDHMSAIRLIESVQDRGGRVTAFCSYGSGVPAPDQDMNPLRYAITWNPRNVVMSAEQGAQYIEDGQIKVVPFHHVFHHTWSVEVDGVGMMEAYPNRDSLSYMDAMGLHDVNTMIRGTLRYPGWCETWAQIVKLGLPNESLPIPGLALRTYREVIEMFLPASASGSTTEQRLARYLSISPTGRIMENLRWLGLFSDEPTGCRDDTSAAMMIALLVRKLPLEPGVRDMVILRHELEVAYPDERPPEQVISTLIARGEPGGMTAMARTVGIPIAAVVKLLLSGEIALTGTQIPTHPSIYKPVLAGAESAGLQFTETTRPIPAPA